MNIGFTLGRMLTLFIVLAVGFCAHKLKIMTETTDKLLSKLVVNIAVPCTIILSVTTGGENVAGGSGVAFLGISFAVFALALLLALFVTKLFRGKIRDGGLIAFMMAFGNVAFMGFPVCQAIFGDASMFFVALFNIPFTLLVYSYGIVMVSGKSAGASETETESSNAAISSPFSLNLRLLLNPSLISALAALALFALGLRPPEIVLGSIELISRMTTPAAMLIIGSSLSSVSPRTVFGEWRLYLLAAVKLIIIPVATWLALRPFVSDPLTLGVLTALSGMPAATSAPMLAYEYGGNTALASGGVFITTALSAATIPLLMYLLI
jgi:predicted permease